MAHGGAKKPTGDSSPEGVANKNYTHRDTKALIRAMLPHWERFCSKVVFWCPSDSKLNFEGYEEHTHGKSGYFCADTNTRHREALRWAMNQKDFDYVWFNEYDAVAFTAPSEIEADCYALYRWNRNLKRYKSQRYLWWPTIWKRTAIAAVVEELDKLPDDEERGVCDRYLGIAIERAATGICDIRGREYSQHTIEKEHLPDALSAVDLGAEWFHGIKDAETLQKIFEKFQNRNVPKTYVERVFKMAGDLIKVHNG